MRESGPLHVQEHRGRRLGTLGKLANLRQLLDASPRTTGVVTHNAAENRPMMAVNEAMGFEVVCDVLTWEKAIDRGTIWRNSQRRQSA